MLNHIPVLNPNKRTSQKLIVSSQLGAKRCGHAERQQLEASRQRVTTLGLVLLKPGWPTKAVIAKANGHDKMEQ